jgi:dihydroorotase
MAHQKLECELTIRAGKIVYDLDGIATPVYPPKIVTKNKQAALRAEDH